MRLSSIGYLAITTLCSFGCSAENFDEGALPSFLNSDGTGAFGEYYGSGEDLSPAMSAVVRLQRDALRNDGFIDLEEAENLLAFTKKYQAGNAEVARYLASLVEETDIVSEEAEERLSSGRWFDRTIQAPLQNDIYAISLGNQDFLFDDELVLRMNGSIHGGTGLKSHSRGYAAKKDGVLFTRHGSYAPHYESTNTRQETEALHAQGPDESLDIAAGIYGLELGSWSSFSSIARDPNYYDPSTDTPHWAGICQGWTHNSLDDRLSILVDVDGDEGERGLWIFGQWISRADLGNAMMGASYSLAIADSYTIDSFVTPKTLIQGLTQHVMYSGIGVRVDIWNDEHNDTGSYNPQIWNQPVVEAEIEVDTVPEDVARDIIAYARANASPWSGMQDHVFVRRVQAKASWGAEANDSWEEEALFKESEWNMYMITNFEGKVLEGYMAHELAQEGIQNLPIETSDGLPDYIAVPRHELTDASFEDVEHHLLEEHNPDGVRYRFLVSTVLARGIPNETRLAFERDFFEGSYQKEELAYLYPTIANAYAPEQWATTFERWLGDGSAFGAVWK